MSAPAPDQLLRAALLDGVGVIVAGSSPAGQCASATAEACARLGARVARCEPARADGVEGAALEALAGLRELDLLAIDAAAIFARAAGEVGGAGAGEGAVEGEGGGAAAAGACLQLTWEITRALANAAFLERARAGRIVLIAPPAELGAHARVACAGLENLARTLSIEWSRHRVTTVCLAPARRTGAGEIAALVTYLASPAGAYFSGCRLDLS